MRCSSERSLHGQCYEVDFEKIKLFYHKIHIMSLSVTPVLIAAVFNTGSMDIAHEILHFNDLGSLREPDDIQPRVQASDSSYDSEIMWF